MDTSDLDDLRLFAGVARLRNFRAAARELGLSPSGLSQRITRMEGRMGVRLFSRTTRSVALTEAGKHLQARIAPALGDLAAAVSEVQQGQGIIAGRLRINAPAPAVSLVLAPMIPPFLAAYPGIQLEIVTESALIDIVAGGYDAGVRFEENLAQDMVAVPLSGPMRYVLTAAPSLLARTGTPKHPQDLVGKPMLTVRFPTGAVLPWEFEKGGRLIRIVPQGPLFATLPELLGEAAIAGTGFLLSFEGNVKEMIARGQLVALLEDWQQPFSGPFLYYPTRRQPPPALKAFLDFIKAWRRRAST